MMPAGPLPHPCLVADVGGTNARFAWVSEPEAPRSPMLVLPTDSHADFAETVREAVTQGGFPAPRSLLIAAAGPVAGLAVTITNARIEGGAIALDGPRLASRLRLAQGLLLNDFEALSLSLPFLKPTDLLRIGGGAAVPGGPLLVVGPGTGLGVGAVLAVDGRLLPVASEGGHAGLGPQTPEEMALWPHLGGGALSAEDLISGRGLLRLYRGIAAMRGAPAAYETPAAVTEAMQPGADPIAVEAAGTLVHLLGRFAGDMALAFCATGGVFIGGGVAPRLARQMQDGGFRAAFESRGQQSSYLAAIPTALVTAGDAALVGLAAIAAAPQRFALSYRDRFWRSV